MSQRPTVLSANHVVMELYAAGVFPRLTALKDAWYVFPTHQWLINYYHKWWLDEFVPWWRHARPRFVANSADCDNFARMYREMLVVSMARSGLEKGGVFSAYIEVEQRAAWANVPAGTPHAINLVRTDRGLYAVEPQNGINTMWSVYPNREFVRQDETYL